MKHTTITIQELECLEHLRNVGHFVNALMQEQDCATVRRDPAQQSQLTSVIYLMTAQLDGVVERCNQRWLTGEANASPTGSATTCSASAINVQERKS